MRHGRVVVAGELELTVIVAEAVAKRQQVSPHLWACLRSVLDQLEDSQAAGDDLLTLQLAEQIEEHGAAISWSAAANAHQVPGTSWTVIGGRLGITRQAAHQRFGAAG